MKFRWRPCLLASLTLLVSACNGRKPVDTQSPHPVPSVPPPLTFTLSTAGLPETLSWKCDPVFGDVNGDGKPDLAAHPRLGRGPKVWLGDGHGTWREAAEGLDFGTLSCGGGVRLADVNNDGHLDLVVADHCNGLYVYLGNGASQWELAIGALYPVQLLTEGKDPEQFIGAESLAVGDVNGDGFLDIVAGGSDSGGISFYLGDGTGRNWFRQECELPTSGWATRVQLADINADGLLDVLASTDQGPRVWLGDGQGHFRSTSDGLPTPQIGGIYVGIAAGDVDEDGRLDLVVSNMIDGPEVYFQQADGSWKKSPDVFPEMMGGAFGLALADIDQDGHLDMVVSGRLKYEVGYVYGVFALTGDGKGGWTYARSSGLPETGLAFTWGVTLADIDGDGVLDLAATSGGKVATAPGRQEPILTPRILIWRTHLTKPR